MFDSDYYLKISGTTMGIKMTPSYDNLFMETGTQSANEITLLGLSRGAFKQTKQSQRFSGLWQLIQTV